MAGVRRAVWVSLVVSIAGALLAGCDRPARQAASPASRGAAGDATAELLGRRLHEPRLSTVGRWTPCRPGGPGWEPADCDPPGPAPASAYLSPVSLTDPPARERGRSAAMPGPGSAQLHRDGLLRILAGTGESLDRGVITLRRAAREGGAADLWNDLAVAHYLRAEAHRDPLDLLRALGALERGRKLAPADPALLFNRALVLDRMHLLALARQAWEEYLDLDPGSDWAVEARQRRAAVPPDPEPGGTALSADDPERVRRELRDDTLGRWSVLADEDPAAARALLDRAAAEAAALAERTGDDLLARSVAAIAAAEERGDATARAHLVRGHRLYRQGSDRMGRRLFQQAEPVLREARRELRAGGSPFAGWAAFLLLRCTYHEQVDGDLLEARAREILERAGGRGNSALRARTWWVLGTSRLGRGDLRGGEEAYLRARDEFRRLGEWRNELRIRSMHANLLEWTGRVQEAWEERHAVLAGLRAAPDPTRRRLMAVDLAYSALALDEPEAALVLQQAAVTLARADGRPLPLANALLKRAGIRQRIGEPDSGAWERADQELAEAARATERIEDPGVRAATRAQLRLEEGRLWRGTDPHRAAAALNEALALHAGLQAPLLVTEAQLEAARVRRALGETAAAEALLAGCLEELERQRATVSDDARRIALSDRAAEVHDELVDLLLDEGRAQDALLAAERGRAQRLREWLGTTRDTTAPTTVPAADGLAPSEALVAYSVLPRRLAIWWITDAGLESATVPVPAREVRELVREVRSALRADLPEADALLADLYELLIAPLAVDLTGRPALRLVLDDQLHLLPFAALVAPGTGRHLVEEHHITTAPTLSAPPPADEGNHSGARRSVLVVADPAFDRALHPSLPRLSGADREGRAVASTYREARLLQGEAATVGAFLRGLGRYDVVHVGAHALPHPRDPLRSRLLLAPGSGGAPGELEAGHVLHRAEAVPGLVVLAACQTVGTDVSRTEGALGLAWAFMARGAREVVATHWNLDDAAARPLFARLHQHLAAGRSGAEALREAQLAALREGTPRHTWAALTLYTVSGKESL